MRRHGTTTFESKSGYGLDRESELASLRAIRAAGGVATWLGAHAVPPEFADADAYLDFALAEVLPEAAEIAEAADVFLERGAFDAAQARRYLEACRDAGLALRLHGDQFTEQGAVPLAIELGARSVDHLEATGGAGVRPLAASEVTACCCRQAPSSSTGRCRPGARSSTPVRRWRSPPTSTRAARSTRACRCAARSRHAAASVAVGGARGVHGERGARPRPRGRPSGGSRRATAPISRCSTPPTGATSPTTWAATWSGGSSSGALP